MQCFKQAVRRTSQTAARGRSVTRGFSPSSSISSSSRASFSVGAKKDYEPINEKEIPRSTYAPGSTVQRSTINVEESAKSVSGDSTVAVPEKVVPLTRGVFDMMPRQMQKLTLMDKVVIVTGYVCSLDFLV